MEDTRRPPPATAAERLTLVDSPPAHESGLLLAGAPRVQASAGALDSPRTHVACSDSSARRADAVSTSMLATARCCFGSTGCPDRLAGAVTLRSWLARCCGTGSFGDLSRPGSPTLRCWAAFGPFGRHGFPSQAASVASHRNVFGEARLPAYRGAVCAPTRATADGTSVLSARTRVRRTLSTRSARQCSPSGGH